MNVSFSNPNLYSISYRSNNIQNKSVQAPNDSVNLTSNQDKKKQIKEENSQMMASFAIAPVFKFLDICTGVMDKVPGNQK